MNIKGNQVVWLALGGLGLWYLSKHGGLQAGSPGTTTQQESRQTIIPGKNDPDTAIALAKADLAQRTGKPESTFINDFVFMNETARAWQIGFRDPSLIGAYIYFVTLDGQVQYKGVAG